MQWEVCHRAAPLSASIAKLAPEVVTIEPLPKRPLLRDLVTDIVPDDEKLSVIAVPSGVPD